MSSRGVSPVGGSDLSSSDELPNDFRRSSQQQQQQQQQERSQLENTDSSSDAPLLRQHSQGALRHPRETRPTGGFSSSVNNDSFGQPLGTTTMFASTRPFSNHQSPTDVEQFLSEPPVSNQTFTPHTFTRGGDTLHVSTNSSFVSIPKTGNSSVDVSSNTSPRNTNTVPPLVVQTQRLVSPSSSTVTPLTATVHRDPKSTVSFSSSTSSQPPLLAHASSSGSSITAAASGGSAGTPAAITATQSSPLMAQSRPPMPTVIKATSFSGKSAASLSKPASAMEKTPSVLVATASSSNSASASGVAGLRSPSRRTPSGAFPSSTSATASGLAPLTQAAAAVVGQRPASPSMNFTRTGSNQSLNSHLSEPASVTQLTDAGLANLANYSPLVRNSLTPSFTAQMSPRQQGYPAVPPVAPVSPPAQREGLLHSRSEGELRNYFSERGAAGLPTPAASAGVPLHRGGDSPGGAGRRSPSRLGGPALSTGSRQRGVVRATESSSGLGGTHNSSRYTPSGSSGGSGGATTQPRWLSAVERMKSSRVNEDLSLYDPVLPYDQSRLGMQTRQAGQQGQLTAGKLRALEAQHTGGMRTHERSGSGGLQPLVAYSVAGGRIASPTSRTGTLSPTRMPVLTAQEEAIQATARYNRAMSEQGGARRGGHIRSVANGGSVSAYGGRHAVTAMPSSSRGSFGTVLTASESVTNNSNFSSANGTFITRSEQGGIPGAAHGGMGARIGAAEHKLANLFQMHTGAKAQGLRANETATYEVVNASGSEGNNGNAGVLRATEEQRAVTPFTGRGGGGSSRGAGGGGGGGGGGSNGGGAGGNGGGDDSNNGTSRRGPRAKRKDLNKSGVTESKELKQAMDAEGDEDERDERTFRTRNINALHAIPWDQRRQLPMTGFGTRFFALLSTPRFWEKLDWTVRGSLLTVLPTMVLALEPTTTNKFPMASSLAFNAFWITMPTFGSGLRELIIALKGFSFGLIFLIIIVATQPGPDWLLLLLLFLFTLFSSFVAEETKKTTAYVLASTIMQYLTDHKGTNFVYVGQYYEGLLIALAFGTAGFLVPFIRWSSDIARHYIKAMANTLSIDVQGTLSSFWVRSPLERELNVMRLRQLRATAEKCIGKIETALDESGYEPHTGAYMACMTNRFNFCKNIHNILGSLSHVIELISDNPRSIDTPMCNAFGEQIGDDLAVISSAMDSMVLKICDFERIVTPQEIQFFREARERFQEAVSRVREDVILTNENYETDESDILLGFFMFSVDEMCEVISQFEETANPPNTLLNAILFPIRDVKSVIFAFKNLALTIVRRRTIPRRLKEAIKLAVCMVLPCIFQVYALGNDQVSPMAGASVIALIYNPTGSESFHYASGRLLGTVLGSMAALLSVQIANGRRWVLYLFIIVLSFIGAYVQAAPGFYALGNAIVCSTISVCTQYTNQNAAMVRIQQNCFAILMYFAVVCILWPMRARTKVKMSLDFSLRCMRESITRMLRNLDMPYDANEVTADVSALLMEMNKKVRTQIRFIPGAVEEPTMGSVEYPEDAWKRIVEAERKLWLALSMMRFAYHTFMTSRADSTTELSVHWVVLHRISPHARDLSDLVYAAIDLYLLSLNNTTVVPTSHLTRLRVGMVEAHKAIEDTYIQTISRKVAGEDSDDEEGEEENDSYLSSYVDDDYYDPSDYGGLNEGGGGGADGSSRPPPTTTNSRVDPERQPPAQSGGGGSGNTAPGSPSGNTATEKDNKNDNKTQKQNASFASPKTDGVRQRRHKTKREGDDSVSSSSKSSDDNNNNDDDKDEKDKKGKKKMGYLGYDLTKDEAAALRAFVANRVVNNGTFGLNRSMAGNMTFNGKSMAGGTAAAAAAAALSGGGMANRSFMAGSPPQVNNDARLMALRGGDDDLAAALRKKHHVTVKKEKDDLDVTKSGTGVGDTTTNADNTKSKTNTGADPQTENLANLNLTNASFFKNHSFLKNASFLGNFFSKKPRETHDLDAEEMRGDDVSSSTSANSKSGKKGKKEAEADKKPHRSRSAVARKTKREGSGSAASSARSTPSTSPTRSRHALRSDGHSVVSEFSDIEDDPKPHRKTGGDKRLVNAAKAKDGRAGGRPPMAQSMPVVLPVPAASAANPLVDGKAAKNAKAADGQPVRMASSTPIVSTSQPSGATEPGNSLPGNVLGNATAQLVPPLPMIGGGSNGTVATIGAHSTEDGHTPFSVTPLDASAGKPVLGGSAPPAASSREPAAAPAAGDKDSGAAHNAEVDNHRFDSSNGTPEDQRKPGKKPDSRDSSNRTGSTEKKILSAGDAEGGTTHGSSDEKLPQRSSDTSDGVDKTKKADDASNIKSPRRQRNADDAATQRTDVSYGTRRSNSMGFRSPRSPGRASAGNGARQSDRNAEQTAELLQSLQEGSHDDDNHFDEGEILNNISFFDPEKGEFVLTNHDIHSLEAFLFGTQALVTYINELQKAILEMQHETDLAKRL